MILHVGSYIFEVKVKNLEKKIILENTKLVMILHVGNSILEVHKSKTL